MITPPAMASSLSGSKKSIIKGPIQRLKTARIDNAYASLFLILFGSRSADPEIRAMFDERVRRLLDCIRKVFQSGMDGGLLRPVDTGILSRMFAGLIYGLLALPEPPESVASARYTPSASPRDSAVTRRPPAKASGGMPSERKMSVRSYH